MHQLLKQVHLKRMLLLFASLPFLMASPAIAQDSYKICYRSDAAPFSYVDDAGTVRGYSVDLCRRVLAEFGSPEPEMVLVTAEDRFEQLKSGTCHLLCEATTVSMKRREEMEFSLITFLTGATFLFPNAMLNGSTEAGAAITVGFLEGTTAHEKYKSGQLVGGSTYDISFKPVGSHEDAKTLMLSGGLQAYVADREILERILTEELKLAENFQVGSKSLSYEPYALAVDMGNDELRTRVDAVLATLFRSGEIKDILAEYIPQRRFDPILLDLFELQSLPE